MKLKDLVQTHGGTLTYYLYNFGGGYMFGINTLLSVIRHIKNGSSFGCMAYKEEFMLKCNDGYEIRLEYNVMNNKIKKI